MAQTIQLKRSAVAGKVPTTGDLSLGELALNTYDGKLYTKKDNGTASIVELSGGGGASVTTSDSAPADPADGDLWFDSVGGRLYCYYADPNGSQWVDASPPGSLLGGNATTATTLQTARTINGTSFNGSANITTSSWGTSRTLTVGNTGKAVDGSGDVSWTLTEIGALADYTVTTTAVSKTLANRERCTVTAATQTITLPASPSAGNEVTVTIGGTFTDTVVARNGSNIMSLAEDLTVDTANVSVTLYYVNATHGWRII